MTPEASIADRFDVFLFDLDGVIHVGEDPLPDAVESVNRLRGMGKQVRFLTNDPRPRRRTVAGRLRDLVIDVELDEIVTSGWATARHLRGAGITAVSTVGSAGLRAELRAEGLELTEEDPEAVVVGADERTSYRDIQRAARHICRGATFVGTNPDGSFPTPEGPAPGAGAVVRAVEATAGAEPTVVGKPEPPMFELALEDEPDGARVVVVGDNAETDVLGAHRAGFTGILVADGEPSYPAEADFRRPDATISTLADLFAGTANEWTSPEHPWPDEVSPGVAAAVFDDAGAVLLVKRADWEQWALPTGTVEACERLVDAVTREVREETGLEVEVRGLSGLYSAPEEQVFTYPSRRVVHFITCCFRCDPVGGTLGADRDEAIDAAFFGTDGLPSDMLPMHPKWIADATAERDRPAIR